MLVLSLILLQGGVF